MGELRVAEVVSAPPVAVERAFGRRAVWARACGISTEAADDPIRPGDRWSRGAVRIEVTAVDPLPRVRLRVPGGSADLRVVLSTTGAGVLTTLDLRTSPTLLGSVLLRRSLLRIGQRVLDAVAADAGRVRLVVAGVVVRSGQVLAARRRRPVEAAGRWELPGGKVEPGESESRALARELQEELGLTVAVGSRIGPPSWIAPDLVLHAWRADWIDGDPVPAEADPTHDEIAWVAPDRLGDLDWLPADVPVVFVIPAALAGQV